MARLFANAFRPDLLARVLMANGLTPMPKQPKHPKQHPVRKLKDGTLYAPMVGSYSKYHPHQGKREIARRQIRIEGKRISDGLNAALDRLERLA